VTGPDESSDRLVGGWRLRRWVATADDGTETFPMGETVSGLVAYAADGTMITVIGSADRPRFTTDDVTGGTIEERAEAFATCIAYGGTYEVDGETVTHRVQTSLFPNWTGTLQQRRWELDETGRRMTLTSPPIMQGGSTRIHRLDWERVGGDEPQD
jgi:hypothetical protein